MNAPYLLVPIGLVLLIIYYISLLFSQLDIISKPIHRKIWNYGLLASFTIAAILGILMVIQINYKMEVPWTEKVLKWHVNFGIAMSVIGIFHLLWHWRYYFPGKKHRTKRKRVKPDHAAQALTNRSSRWMFFMIGFAGIAFQTFLIRELLSLFQGNELMISMIMFLWMLITGCGALTGNRTKISISEDVQENRYKSRMLIVTLLLLPIISLPLMYYCKVLFFAPGVEAGPLAFSGFLLLILTPFCFLNGFSFTFLVRSLTSPDVPVRKAYAWESIGSATAGLVCTVAILAGIFSPPGGKFMEKLFHPNDEIVATRSGPSGRLTITRNGDQVNVFENGILAQSSGNTMICEEMAHFAMTSHPLPRNILVIGGLLSGIDQELKKYGCLKIDLIEPNPQIFKLAKKLNLIQNPTLPVRYIHKPVSVWINHPDTRYDVILVMLPGPQNLSLNRFYTLEFFKKMKKCLNSDGILSVMLPGTANYISEEAINAIGPVTRSMQKCFRQALLFPGENNYLIAGNTPLRTDILEVMKTRNITALYVSNGYFDETRFQSKMKELNDAMRSDLSINTDLKPKAYFGQIAWWLGHFPDKIVWPLVAIMAVLLFSCLVSGHSAYSSMFIMGAGASGIEIILLFLLQITAGSLYLLTGLLLASFMTGLALGSMEFFKGRLHKLFTSETWILLAFIVTTALLAGLSMWSTRSGGGIWLKAILIILLTFMISVFIGSFFASLTKTLSSAVSGGLIYVFDMLGGAIGAIIYPLAIIPLLGILPAIGIISASGVLILFLLKARRS
ncbi:MAG: hypothetical protein PHY99_04670 [Bacteroidales bacterium]|nr:hypothetical protein [Bacteroidales bacterium]